MDTSFTKTREEWLQKFKEYDRNKDGVIECWELKRFLQVMGLNPTDKEVTHMLKHEFQKTENDAISFDDFYQWVIQQRDPLGELYDAFKTFDKDDSGYLDLEEFRKIMSCISDEKELKEFFSFVDADNDGKIAYKEFVDIFCEM